MTRVRHEKLVASTCATIALLGLFWVSGCGGSAEKIDEGVVQVSEPSPTSTGTAAGAGTPPPAASGTDTASADSAKGAAAPASTGATAEGWGTLKGRVVFGGDAPAAKVLIEQGKAPKDPQVCSTSPIMSERLSVNPENKGVRYAIVYIPKPTRVNPDAEKAALQANVEFDQEKCVFVPHVMAVYKGATVHVLNSDSVGHNVNLRLRFNAANFAVQPAAKVAQTVRTAESRPGEVVCDIHPWMKAWWLVSSSPYFAVTDENGNFEIPNVPAGEQKVVVWAEALNPGTVTAAAGDPVTISPGGEPTVKEFTLDPAKVKPE